MFSLIKKMIDRVKSIDQLYERIEQLEAKLQKHEGFAAENEALWQFLDDQQELEPGLYVGSSEDFADQISDIMLKKMKTRGDA